MPTRKSRSGRHADSHTVTSHTCWNHKKGGSQPKTVRLGLAQRTMKPIYASYPLQDRQRRLECQTRTSRKQER